MCGICGIVELNKDVSTEKLKRLNNEMNHRGPDGDGYWIKKNFGIAQKRLAIVDLVSGQQPMSNEDDSIWVTFNGEIYNYPELRKELENSGHHFKTNSDTEVLLHGYEEWGFDSVKHFRGMFAFGLIDLNKDIAFIARDHMGIKPLVYYFDGNTFAFASEIKALKQLEGIKLTKSLDAMDKFLWLQYIPAPQTTYNEIFKLLPGHYITISLNSGLSNQTEYWDLKFNPDYSKSEEDWLQELDELLSDSVKAHLMSDVPFGAFLSGGIDSTTIVSYMSQHLDRPVKTFSIGFEDEGFDERNYAREAARVCQTEHHEEIVKPDVFGLLPELVSHYGEPFGDSSAVPTYYVSKLARKHVTMVLSGDGGDELFAGYETHRAWLDRITLYKENKLKAELRFLYKKYIKNQDIVRNGENLPNWLSMINYTTSSMRSALWKDEFRSSVQSPLKQFEELFDRTKGFSTVNKVQYMDIKTYMTYAILSKVDIASMMNSLEVRTPIIDKVIAEFAATIPQEININYSRGELTGKLLLKKLLERKFPKEFIYRRKMGFAMPTHKWIGTDERWRKELNSRLLSKDSNLNEYFEKKQIETFINKGLEGPVWLLLFLEEWLRQNK